jgi:hypothetical protein
MIMNRYQTIISIDKTKVKLKIKQSTYGSCHDHDCMIVGFTSTYGSCHGHDCMKVGFTSTYSGCHGHDYNGSLIVIFNLLNFFAIIQS